MIGSTRHLVSLALLLTCASGSLAQQDPLSSETLPSGTPTLVVDGSGRTQLRLAYPPSTLDAGLAGDFLAAAREVEETLREDLAQMAIFNVQGAAELSVLTITGVRDHDFEQYRSLGNEVVLLVNLKKEGDKVVLDGWVYDLPSKQSILGKRFRGTVNQARLIAHNMADALHHQFTGRPGIALTSLVFQSDRDGFQELFLMDYDGHNQRRISGHKSTSGYSDWSSTGDAIAYMSYFSGTPGIYFVDLATGTKVPIYREGVLNLSPSFSPDGKFVAFASAGSDGNIDVFVCERSCQQPRRLTTAAAIDTNPAWSPDGKQIAFTSNRAGKPQIFVMDVDGQNSRRVTFEGDYNEGATWRPDMQQIAYATRVGNKFKVAATNLIDLTTRILTQGEDSYEEPSYSPDGQKIAFTRRRGRDAQVFVINADGSGLRQITFEGNNSAPDWSSFPNKP